MDERTDVLIVGAGFAGAATAFHLAAGFGGSITIVDKEEVAGFHASGRNAALLLQSVASAALRRLLVESRRAYRRHREEVGFRETGSLLLGSPAQLEEVREAELLPSEVCSPDEVRGQMPALEGHAFDAALRTPSDGVMDVARLLNFYLEGASRAGVRCRLGVEIEAVEGSGPFRVRTSKGTIEAGVLVNAAGAWAPRIAELAGVAPLPLYPLKRHLFVLDEIEGIAADGAFVWSLAAHFYFRPESGGLLFSVCDEEPSDSLEPTVSSEISERLAELIWKQLPALQDAVQRRVWSCFRTKTPDGHLALGPDPAHPAFFWVAGLGGHGMGASWEIGRLAAESLQNPAHLPPKDFRPSRLSEQYAEG